MGYRAPDVAGDVVLTNDVRDKNGSEVTSLETNFPVSKESPGSFDSHWYVESN